MRVNKNKANAESIHEAPQPDPMYTALMNRLDAMDGMLAKRETEIKKKEEGPRKVAVEPIQEISPEPFRIQGSTRTAPRQLMEHFHSQQMERASARERMYKNFLPL